MCGHRSGWLVRLKIAKGNQETREGPLISLLL
jgi:hypothetical protein